MKLLKRLSLILLTLFVLLMGVGYLLRYRWSKDIESLEIKKDPYSFVAKRDETGVWNIEAPDKASLYFAMGYVQSLDREFQTQALRKVSRGEGSEIFGESLRKNDVLKRYSLKLAELEMQRHSQDEVHAAPIRAFISGYNTYQKNVTLREPIEFQVLNLKRSDFKEWEPIDVYSIVRYHSWEFSFDQWEELRSHFIRKNKGVEWQKFLLPEEPAKSLPLYDQKTILGGTFSTLAAGLKTESSPAFALDRIRSSLHSKNHIEARPFFEVPVDKLYSQSNPLAASNAWIMADPRTNLGPTLCNDTHLGFFWPSALYPVRFKVTGLFHGSGYMLPGVPSLVIGDLNFEKSSRTWGITLGSFADTQDFIEVSKETLIKSKHFEEVIRIRDPKTGAQSEEKKQMHWTSYGPALSGVLPIEATDKDSVVALDWMGFRDFDSPLGFFLRRLDSEETRTREDIAKYFSFPAVNFQWIERASSGAIYMGHALTGTLFKNKLRTYRKTLTEAEAQKRELSYPGERPSLYSSYQGTDPFLMVSGNQRVYPGEFSKLIANDWYDGRRAERLLSQLPDLSRNPEKAQNDYFVPIYFEFWKAFRKRVSVQRLCRSESGVELRECEHVVGDADAWNGIATVDSKAPVIISQVFHMMLKNLWPVEFKKSESKSEFTNWAKSSQAHRMLMALLNKPESEEIYSRLYQKNLVDDLLVPSFDESYVLLNKNFGPASEWKWGRVHKLKWKHPLAMLPDPLGSLMSESLFGPAPSVPGGIDSPGRFEVSWDPDKPLEMASTHGAVVRFCKTLNQDGTSSFKWTNVTGPSGNPFSKWSRKFSDDYFFKDKLFEVR